MSGKQPSPPCADGATEGSLREQLAAYFLSVPPISEQTPAQRREYLEQLSRLGTLERKEILQAVGGVRPLVWGNPAGLIQALLTAAQLLAARLGQPLLLFPAKEASIGFDTLLHPRLLSIALAQILCDGVKAAPRQSLWVRLQEQSHCLAVAITGAVPFIESETLALLKECTRLHGGSLVRCDNTLVFTCGQVNEPPPGIRLYSNPTAEDLLRDTLSPVWTAFYAGIHNTLAQSDSKSRTNSSTEGEDTEGVSSSGRISGNSSEGADSSSSEG